MDKNSRTKFASSMLVFLLMIGCAIKHQSNGFVEFINKNTTQTKADSEITSDKMFKLQIPDYLSQSETIVSDNFLHVLHFKQESRIILLYDPDRHSIGNYKSGNLNYKDFVALCEKEKIFYDYELEKM